MNYFIAKAGLWPNFTSLKKSLWMLMMRLSLINAILLVAGIKMLTAAPAYGQEFDKATVVLELNNETIQSAITQIQHQSDFNFVTPSLREARRVSLPKKEYNLKQILEKLMASSGLNLRYRLSGNNYITIYEVDNTGSEKSQGSINSAIKTAMSVGGRVTDASTGTPLPGVNVLIKGTTHGTATDADGGYTLEAETSDVLIFSSIGFKTTETAIAGKTTIDVSLQSDATEIPEVVVHAGYWDVNEKEGTGSISKVTSDQISKQPVVNPLQSLQGRLTGVYVSPTSGVPGSSFTIQIRGRNSLRYDGNEPLYVVDGVPYTNSSIGSGAGSTIVGNSSPFNNIDPSSIESVEVLKDADATAIYGSQGANGVVLITTKRGKAGKTNVTANFSSGIAQVPHMLTLLNTEQYLEMRREAYANDGTQTYPTNAYDVNQTWDQNRYTDWQKVLFGGTARMTNADASISGGSTNTRFLVGGSYVKQTTVFPGDFAYQRGAAHFNFIHDSENRKLQFVVTANYSGDNNNLPANDLVSEAMRLPPNAPALYNDDGSLNWENGTWTNPFSELAKKYKAKTKGLFANSTLSYEIIKGLKAKVNMGYNTLQMREVSTNPVSSLNPFASSTATAKGQAYFGISGTNTWVVEPQLEFIKKAWIGNLTVFAATTFRRSTQDIANIAAYGYTVDALIESLKSAPVVTPVTWSNPEYRYSAGYGRINYTINDRYIINLTGRRDGSSRFGPNRQFANFGAVGAAWIFSNEAIFSRSKILSFGKLRGSLGTAGNDQIGDYQYLKTYQATSSYTGAGTSISPKGIANPNYAWEVNRKIEAAINLGFINDRIKLGINWYRNQSSNQLVGQSIPTMTGFSTFQANLPATVRNQGWEFELSTTNITTNSLRWTSSFNLTLPTNELVSYPNIENSSFAYTYEVGKSTFATKKYHYLGVDPVTGVYQFADADQNGSPFDDVDKIALTKVAQDFYGGFRNTLTWCGFEANIFFQFTRQTGRNYLVGPFNPPGVMGNQPAFVMQRWTDANPMVPIQKFTAGVSTPAGYAYQTSTLYGGTDFAVSDASFIRLQNVSLEWAVPRSLLKKSGIAGVSIYAQGQNVLTWTNYYGLDPQTTSFVSLPTLRVVTCGVKLSL